MANALFPRTLFREGSPRLTGYRYLLPGYLTHQFHRRHSANDTPLHFFLIFQVLPHNNIEFVRSSVSLLFGVILTSGIRGKKFFRAVIYLPNLVSAVALATMWLQYVYSSKFGLLKSILDAVGMHKLAETAWLDTDHKFGALLFAYCFGMIGYHMLIWMSGIERISPELYEAATIDGANRPQQFQHMTLPLLKGVFKTNITMWSVSTAAFFVWSQMFSTVTADEATIVPVQYMYMQTFGAGNAVTERNAGYGAAIGIILCICIVVIFTICNKLIKEDDLEF